ncbi:MAG: PDZ domain-containing protein [Steroidobacteraceae bacterium]
MNKMMVAMVAMVAMIATMTFGAVAAPALAADEESRAQQLAEAQRRLEDAAREVAELSGEAAAGAMRNFEFFLPGTRRAMLGVNLGGAEANGGGVRVAGVSPGGPAAEAGVEAGDIIVAIEKKKVTTGRELVTAMADIEPGEKVDLDLKRAGKPLKLVVEARALNQMFFAGTRVMPSVPAIPAFPSMPSLPAMAALGDGHWLLDAWGDAEFVTLTPGLGRYFGADEGVLVARAPADKGLGLEDGDVIVAIGGREPENGRHAMRILRSYEPGEAIELRILRDRRARTLEAKVPERVRRGVLRQPAEQPEPPRPPDPPEPPVAT